MKNITIMGGGVLGSQIAFQSAYCGFNVTIWLRSKESIKRTQPKLDELKKTYLSAIDKMATETGKNLDDWCLGISSSDDFDKEKCIQHLNLAYDNIKLELDIEKSLKDSDLVIESMTEDFNAKKELYLKMKPLIKETTIIVTNSSTMLPSKLAKYTNNPENFLALHFANSIWKNNIVEVMKHAKTNQRAFDEVIKFSKEINMIPLPLTKEKSGYLLNSMLIPFLFASLDLYVTGISDPKSIDTAWTRGTGAPEGPFQILDKVGLKTAYDIVEMYVKIPSFIAPYHFKEMSKLLKEYINNGKLGKSTGEGFYKYDK